MQDLRIGYDVEQHVATRHHAAAVELGRLDDIPDLGSGPGTLAMLRIFAAVLTSSDELARASDATAESVRRVAHLLRATDAEVEETFGALGSTGAATGAGS